MKKKLFVLLATMIMIFVISGCSKEVESPSGDTPFEMEQVGYSTYAIGIEYYRDITTDVLYLWRKAGYGAGFTVMLDPETGLPLTYTKYMELYHSSNNSYAP